MWLLGGALLAVAELALPGMIAVFIGAAAMVVGALRALGLVESMGASLVLWMASSAGLLLGVRRAAMRFLPSESRYDPHRPDVQAMGEIVDVVETVPSDGTPGRIRHQGTTWEALSDGAPIPAGGKARLVVRDNLVWRVEPVEPGELDGNDPAALPRGRS